MTTQEVVAAFEAAWDADVARASMDIWRELEMGRHCLSEVIRDGRLVPTAHIGFATVARSIRLRIDRSSDRSHFLTDVAFDLVQAHPGCDAHVENDAIGQPFVVLYLMSSQ